MKEMNEVCPLSNTKENHKTRYNPKNARAAYCFQIHDSLRVLYGFSALNSLEPWNKQLDVLQSQINLARNV